MNENEIKHRIKNSIILLTDGHPFKVGDLTFGAKGNCHFSVTGWTLYSNLKYLTRQKALAELDETKDLFKQMLVVSTELADFIKDREIEYCLGYDYGMGGLEICTEAGGQIRWTTTLEN